MSNLININLKVLVLFIFNNIDNFEKSSISFCKF